MSDEYLNIKIDYGLIMRKIKEWELKKQIDPDNKSMDIIFSVGINEEKNADNQPLYRSRGIAVWHNTENQDVS